MQDEKNKPAFIKSVQILHRALLLGQILFIALAFFLHFNGYFAPILSGSEQVLQTIAVLLSFGGFYTGKYLFEKKILAAKESTLGLNTKFSFYRSASLLQWSLLEGSSFFCVVCFLLTGNYAFLALAATLMLILAMVGPSKLKIGLLLRLSQEELEQL